MSSYTPEDAFSPEPPKSRTAIKIIIAVVLIGLGIICCGCLGMIAVSWMAYGDSVETIKGNRVVQQNLGDVTTAEIDLQATGELAESGGQQQLVYRVEGTNGSGKVIVATGPAGLELKTLILEDGTEIDLQVQDERIPMEFEIDSGELEIDTGDLVPQN
ncbi:cytochrome c oxidase assembly factor Coa1 family protein [Rosistilla oblonga]|uniref:cytochrome c oxidase assembly factor Coa1 family protein n=1 Tax=Rosistilla oblonga TaxID=2527990 RepID=UPI003A9872E9